MSLRSNQRVLPTFRVARRAREAVRYPLARIIIGALRRGVWEWSDPSHPCGPNDVKFHWVLISSRSRSSGMDRSREHRPVSRSRGPRRRSGPKYIYAQGGRSGARLARLESSVTGATEIYFNCVGLIVNRVRHLPHNRIGKGLSLLTAARRKGNEA